ncbi:uncharacterized protein LOC117328801 [Pecten maximus]|uniref:uncharacterized protein LOC117328801 n=1 Tax=Pecten maximus TaxID=6579 RepID=UPI001458AB52|nr:uncharacterized protein LOC117328801 [Pecten maximus]
MSSLQICLMAIFASVVTSQETFSRHRCLGYRCGCIYKDIDEIDDKDLIHEPLRTQEFQYFSDRLRTDLRKHWMAKVFITASSKPDGSNDIEAGRPICKQEMKDLLGMWKDNGNTLCWIVAPDMYKAECCSEQCCGPNTRCVPSVYVRRRYLIYCNYYYDGPLADNRDLIEIGPEDFDLAVLDGISTPEGSGFGANQRLDGTRRGYFAFRDDPYPVACSCRTC